MGPLPCAHPGTRALDNVTDFDPCLDIYSLETEANNLMLIQPTRMYIPNPQILKSPPSFLLCLSTGYFWPSYHARSRTGASSLSVIGAERTTSDRQYLLHQRTAIQCGNGPFIIADFVLATRKSPISPIVCDTFANVSPYLSGHIHRLHSTRKHTRYQCKPRQEDDLPTWPE